MTNKHYIAKNILGGSFCTKCFNWSNMPDGLKNDICNATREEVKTNRKLLRTNPHLPVRDEKE
jgi:hypothetical protein